MPGGRKGGADTLRLNAKLRMKYEKKGWNHEQGLDLSEEHIKPSPSRQVPGSARNGKFVDLTFTKTRGKKKEWLRVQTVTTERGGKLTKSELAAAQRIRQAHPRDELHIYGKNTGRRIRNWNAR